MVNNLLLRDKLPEASTENIYVSDMLRVVAMQMNLLTSGEVMLIFVSVP